MESLDKYIPKQDSSSKDNKSGSLSANSGIYEIKNINYCEGASEEPLSDSVSCNITPM